MTLKIKFSTFLSIIICLGVVSHHDIISGMNPFLGYCFYTFLLAVLIWNLILINREPNKKNKLIQLSILVLAVLIGFLVLKLSIDIKTNEAQRRIYQTNSKI